MTRAQQGHRCGAVSPDVARLCRGSCALGPREARISMTRHYKGRRRRRSKRGNMVVPARESFFWPWQCNKFIRFLSDLRNRLKRLLYQRAGPFSSPLTPQPTASDATECRPMLFFKWQFLHQLLLQARVSLAEDSGLENACPCLYCIAQLEMVDRCC